MKIKILHQLDHNLFVNIVLHLLYERKRDFKITKEKIILTAKNLLQVYGVKLNFNFSNRPDIANKKKIAEAIGRKYFPLLFKEVDNNSTALTFLRRFL